MLKIFIDKPIFKNKSSSVFWDKIVDKSIKNIDTSVGYYNVAEKTVSNQHLLVKTIKILSVDLELSIEKYKELVTEKMMFNLNNLGYITFNRRGETMFESIYKYSMNTIMLGTQEYNMYSLKDTWRTVSPIIVTGHNGTDISFNHPEYNDNMLDIYFELDPVLLMLQYREWCLVRKSENKSTSIKIFTYQYPLANLIPSFLDHSLVNIYLEDNLTLYYNPTHPFYIGDMSLLCLKVNMYCRKQFKETNISYSHGTLLDTIKLVTVPTAVELLQFKNYTSRSNMKWFFYLTSINVCRLLLLNQKSKSGNMNKNSEHFMYLELKHDLRSSVFRDIDQDLFLDINALYSKLKKG